MPSYEKRQTKKGVAWSVRFRVRENGREVNKRLSGFSTKRAAEQAYKDYAPENKPAEKHEVEEAFEEFMRAKQFSTSCAYDYRKTAEKFFTPLYGRYIEDLTKADMMAWQANLWNSTNPGTGKFYSQKYLSNIRGLLHSFFSWAEDMYGAPNPMATLKTPVRRQEKREMQVWTSEQFALFSEVCADFRYKVFFSMLFYSGCRVGEVLALRAGDIKKDGTLYRISVKNSWSRKARAVTPPKTANSNRSILLPEIMTPLLDAYLPGGSIFVFGDKLPLNQKQYERAFESYTEKAGLPRIRIHDLRHSHATMLINIGTPITAVSKRLGHSSVKMTLDTYSHCYSDDDKNLVAGMDKILGTKRVQKENDERENQ